MPTLSLYPQSSDEKARRIADNVAKLSELLNSSLPSKTNDFRDLVLTARTFICALVITGLVGKDAHQ